MTNPNLTTIAMLIDRSGSMGTIKSDMEGAINSFVASQRELPGDVEFTLAQFDDTYEVVWDRVPLHYVNQFILHPRGLTALHDAMGKLITSVGTNLASRPEAQRPGKVVVVVVTDGLNNSSREWTADAIQKLVDQQRAKYSWEFVFLGKGIDSFDVAQNLGILRHNTMDFTNSANAMSATSRNIGAYRSSGVMSEYTLADRTEAVT